MECSFGFASLISSALSLLFSPCRDCIKHYFHYQLAGNHHITHFQEHGEQVESKACGSRREWLPGALCCRDKSMVQMQ